jgi:hypothetical protein
MSNTQSNPNKFFILLFGVLFTGLAYFVFGFGTYYGVGLIGMLSMTILLGIFGKISSGRSYFGLFSLIILGMGSLFLFGEGLYSYGLIARVLSILLFIFVALGAIGAILKFTFALGSIGLIVFAIGSVFQDEEISTHESTEIIYEEKEGKSTEINSKNALIVHNREWRDSRFNAYNSKLEVWEKDYLKSKKNRDGLKGDNTGTSQQYWHSVYTELSQNDALFMDKVLESLLTLWKSKKLNQLEFAQMVVSCVQDIPYILIYSDNCSQISHESAELAELAERYGCRSNFKFGLQAPAEFLYNLEGDCDTRTVFLFTVLGKLGYKVCIMNSEEYGHSILGVAIPAKGKYKKHRGANYYVWETTAKGWKIGSLPPETGNLEYWDVILTN